MLTFRPVEKEVNKQIGAVVAGMRLGNGTGACVATGLGSDAGLTTRAALDEFVAETPLRS